MATGLQPKHCNDSEGRKEGGRWGGGGDCEWDKLTGEDERWDQFSAILQQNATLWEKNSWESEMCSGINLKWKKKMQWPINTLDFSSSNCLCHCSEGKYLHRAAISNQISAHFCKQMMPHTTPGLPLRLLRWRITKTLASKCLTYP